MAPDKMPRAVWSRAPGSNQEWLGLTVESAVRVTVLGRDDASNVVRQEATRVPDPENFEFGPTR